MRNHGDSPHNPVHTYTSMAQDIEAYIQENNLKKPSLIGHSMGAKAAMTVALRRPDLISSFIAVDNSPVTAPLGRSFTRYAEGMRGIEAANVKSQKEADQILQKYEKALPVRQFLLTNLIRDQETGKYNFRIPVQILSNALDEMAAFPYKESDSVKFEGPAMFIRGTQSSYVKDESRPLIKRFFPNYQMVDVDAGHWLISEKPQEFKDAVTQFLS
ncbi:alpha/beta hydrolase [Ascosphaera apis ARSEF 7405]|uniref:Alpha/beta hydrolase n=1 Tax=Ascosphaera apis ARSEF 7405 TaxID=392613 RepID=A0A168AYY6_9EURO|nr:alpha/beta hydrolase [Ascosphaera apis ARSEF 7405]